MLWTVPGAGVPRWATYVPVALAWVAPDVPVDVLAARGAVHAETRGKGGVRARSHPNAPCTPALLPIPPRLHPKSPGASAARAPGRGMGTKPGLMGTGSHAGVGDAKAGTARTPWPLT